MQLFNLKQPLFLAFQHMSKRNAVYLVLIIRGWIFPFSYLFSIAAGWLIIQIK